MPYAWTETPSPDDAELHLWPHRSMTAEGFALFMAATLALAMLPLVWFVGTFAFWGLLPFMLAAVAGLYYALRRNGKDRHILEVLTISGDHVQLTRHDPRTGAQSWEDNPYWVRVTCHTEGGPVPFYITLKGTGCEVEIGAFLSEDERKALYDDLRTRIRGIGQS